MMHNLFKIEYDWCEGEHGETLLGKDVEQDEFENDLIEARNFAKSLIGKKVEGDYLGKGYSVECLPEYYKQVLWFLTEKKRYIQCFFDEDISYSISDDRNEEIVIDKSENITDHKEL